METATKTTTQSGRSIVIRLTRNRSVDHTSGAVSYTGFHFYWPDGRPIQTGLDKFCQRGVRLLFGRRGLERESQLVELMVISISGRDAPLPKTPPGTRSRRFFLLRQESRGILHFLNGTATDVIFDEWVDEPEVLDWIGLTDRLPEGVQGWLDMVALPVEEAEYHYHTDAA
jgi:hypothetical protein